MMLIQSRTFVMLSLLAGALPVAACMETEEAAPDETALDLGEPDPVVESAADLEQLAERDTNPACPNKRFTLSGDGDLTRAAGDSSDKAAAASCPVDIYFHPNNGLHGGWIESWRLCYQGGNTYQICRGGYAPVRFWNPSACGGTVLDWYPQGWHGWAQTYGSCC